jgi:hypothetical protein
MRPQPLLLLFGERSFTLRPLTLGQCREIEDLLDGVGAEGEKTSVHATAMKIFGIALRRDHPEATDEFINELESPEGGVVAMSRRILRFGGFEVPDEPKIAKPGEAEAEAPAAKISGAKFTEDF